MADDNMSDQQHKQAQKRLSNATKVHARLRRIIFGLIILLLVIFALFGAYDLPTYQALLIGAASSLFTSLLFLVVYIVTIEAPLKDVEDAEFAAELDTLDTSIKQGVNEALDRRLGLLLGPKALHFVGELDQLLPNDFFPPSDDSNPDFVRQLGEGVHVSRNYIFRGGSAKYTAELLRKSANPSRLSTCRVLTLDPRSENAIRVHAQDRVRLGKPGPQGPLTLQQAEAGLRDEIRIGIERLYSLHDTFSIVVRTCSDFLFYRSEIIDSGAFISFYTEDRTTSNPPTYLYDPSTFYYKAFLRDFEQSWGQPRAEFVISANTSRADLDKFLAELGLEGTKPDGE